MDRLAAFVHEPAAGRVRRRLAQWRRLRICNAFHCITVLNRLRLLAVGAGGSVTRAEWLERAAAVGAGLVSGGIVVGGFASLAASSPSKTQDVEVLNVALAFEELQSDFYAGAVHRLALQGDWLQFATVVGAQERAHVSFVRRALGAAANPAPRLTLSRPPSSVAEFQHLAVVLEDIGVALYNGQAGNLTPGALAAAAEIVSVEARHAAWARDLAGEVPAPVATEVPADLQQVKARLAQAGVQVG